MKNINVKSRTILLTFLLSSCVPARHAVRYDEMTSPPTAEWVGNSLVITTTTSTKHPDLSIYEIIPTVDHNNRVILLKAYQAADQNPKTKFGLPFSYKIGYMEKLKTYKIFWADPNGQKIEVSALEGN